MNLNGAGLFLFAKREPQSENAILESTRDPSLVDFRTDVEAEAIAPGRLVLSERTPALGEVEVTRRFHLKDFVFRGDGDVSLAHPRQAHRHFPRFLIVAGGVVGPVGRDHTGRGLDRVVGGLVAELVLITHFKNELRFSGIKGFS